MEIMQLQVLLKHKIALGIAFIFAFTTFMLWSYIYTNQPTCPLCHSTVPVILTWKNFHKAKVSAHVFHQLGPIGWCDHFNPEWSADSKTLGAGAVDRIRQEKSHLGWYCLHCQKHVLRPPNWRS